MFGTDYYKVAEEISDDKALSEAFEMILESTKTSLGKLLVEGLALIANGHHQDPFGYLGRWLLIQADIKDEQLQMSADD